MTREVGGPRTPGLRSVGRAGGIGQGRCERPRDQPAAALQNLDPLARIADRKDSLVEIMELRHDLRNVVLTRERPIADRQLERPDLMGVPSL